MYCPFNLGQYIRSEVSENGLLVDGFSDLISEGIKLSIDFISWGELRTYAFTNLFHLDAVAAVVELCASFAAPAKAAEGSIWTASSRYCPFALKNCPSSWQPSSAPAISPPPSATPMKKKKNPAGTVLPQIKRTVQKNPW